MSKREFICNRCGRSIILDDEKEINDCKEICPMSQDEEHRWTLKDPMEPSKYNVRNVYDLSKVLNDNNRL